MGLMRQQGKHPTAYARKVFVSRKITIIKLLPPLHHVTPKAQSPEHWVPYEPQTATKKKKSFPITTRKGEGAAHTELIKRATKTGSSTLKCRDSLFLPPSPLQRQQTERAASGYIHRHPAQSAAPQVVAAMRSARSSYSPEITTYFY